MLWSDETYIRLFLGSPSYVWHEPHEKCDIDCIDCTVKHSPGRMYWGCFSYYGVGPLVLLKSSCTSASHLEILKKYALLVVNEFSANNRYGCPVFVQDNARPHMDTKALDFLTKN